MSSGKYATALAATIMVFYLPEGWVQGNHAQSLTMDAPRLAAAKLTSRTGQFLAALGSQILK